MSKFITLLASHKIATSIAVVVIASGAGYGGYTVIHNNSSNNQKQTTQVSKKTPKQQINADSLPNIDKQTLALLGLPDGFVSDYGDLNKDTILAGKSNVTSNAEDSTQYDNGQNGKINSVDFSGIKISQDGDKNLVKLNGVSDTIDNIVYVQGYFTINGDTVTYKNEGTRVSGEEQEAGAKQLGTKSLKELYKQYKDDSNFKKVKAVLTIDGDTESSSNANLKSIPSSSEDNQKSLQSMNVDNIKQGDFSSIVGTWKRPDGNTVIINADGTFTSSDSSAIQKIYTDNSSNQYGVTELQVSSYPNKATVGGSMSLLIPANTTVQGLSTQTEDSILIGQNNMDELVYTRVK